MSTTSTDDRGESEQSEPGYAEALAELQEILRDLETEMPDVDQLADRVARASTLIGLCRDRISAARFDVERVVADLESPQPVDDGTATGDPAD